jgi:predicted dehydrogenase
VSDVTRVAVVGTGDWWGWEHARAFSCRTDTELVAIVGRRAERAAQRAAEFGVASYTDVDEMIRVEQPDLVSLCLPNQSHFEPTIAVIRAGIPLLVEKPLVFVKSEADQLLAEAAERDVFFAINFNHRYAKPITLARKAIEAGELGDVVFATWRFGGEAGTSTDPHANLIETQCHAFDQLEDLCGPIDSVMAQMTDRTGRGFSTMAIALHFASGAVGTLLGSYDSSYAYPETHRLEINGTAGRLVVDDTVKRFTFNAAGSETASVWEAGYFNDDGRQFHRMMDRHLDDLLAALRSGGEPPIHARAGARTLDLALATIRSFETGDRVAVPA